MRRLAELSLVAALIIFYFATASAAKTCQEPQAITTNCALTYGSSTCRTSTESGRCPNNENGNQYVDLQRLKAQDPKLSFNYQALYNDRKATCKNWLKGHQQSTARYRTLCVAQHARPELTDDVIREEFKRLPLSRGDPVFQPSWGALVNKKEIFYTRAERDRTYRMTLLGHQVVLRSHVDSYTWSWGDGSAVSTFRVPGGPYPDFDVSHVYDAAGTCAVSVTLTYSATYTVDGGPVQQVQGTTTVPGNPVDVHVLAAHSVLVDGDH